MSCVIFNYVFIYFFVVLFKAWNNLDNILQNIWKHIFPDSQKRQLLTPESIRRLPCCILMCAMTLSVVDIATSRSNFMALSTHEKSQWLLNWIHSHSSWVWFWLKKIKISSDLLFLYTNKRKLTFYMIHWNLMFEVLNLVDYQRMDNLKRHF